MKTLIASVVLAGLPLVAAAGDNVDVAQCAATAERFSSDARSLSIGDLDRLKTCITLQVEAMGNEAQLQRPRVTLAQRIAKSALRDDL